MERGFEVKALGEIAIRCRTKPKMVDFYRDVVGLEILEGNYSPHITFLRVAPGHGGHTTVLALFEEGQPETGAVSSLHHLALTVDREAQDAVEAWLTEQGQPYRIEQFDWIGWRGIFCTDPEGNTVEFVAKDHAEEAG